MLVRRCNTCLHEQCAFGLIESYRVFFNTAKQHINVRITGMQ